MPQPPHPPDVQPEMDQAVSDIAVATELLFQEIVSGTALPDLKCSMADLNRQMQIIRPYEAAFIPNLEAEYEALAASWKRRDLRKLRDLLQAYAFRRQALVPQILELMNRAKS